MKIDAEVHFWKYEKSVRHNLILKNKMMQQHYLPDQIEQSLQRNGIGGCIAVSAEKAEVETRFLCELAKNNSLIRAVVGRLDLLSQDAVDKIHEFQAYESIRGYQHTVSSQFPEETVMDLLVNNEYCLDLELPFDEGHEALRSWIAIHPEQKFVLQSAGSPNLTQPIGLWEKKIRDLSANPNLHCKVSGFIEQANPKSWKPADFYSYLDILFDAFGFRRLLFASNWPFVLTGGMYIQWKSLLEKYTEGFPEDETAFFFGENAESLYKL